MTGRWPAGGAVVGLLSCLWAGSGLEAAPIAGRGRAPQEVTAPGPEASVEDPGPGGRVLAGELRLDVNPRGVTVLVEYDLLLDEGVERIPVEAPLMDVGYAYELEAEWDGTDAVVRPASEGPPRTLVVERSPPGPSGGGEVRVVLVYRLARVVAVDGSGGLDVRVPVASIPWPVAEAGDGAFVSHLRLPAGIALDEASPGGWEPEPEAENRLRYVRSGDAFPGSVEVRASLAIGRSASRPRLPVGLLIGGLAALALLITLPFLFRRRFGRRG